MPAPSNEALTEQLKRISASSDDLIGGRFSPIGVQFLTGPLPRNSTDLGHEKVTTSVDSIELAGSPGAERILGGAHADFALLLERIAKRILSKSVERPSTISPQWSASYAAPFLGAGGILFPEWSRPGSRSLPLVPFAVERGYTFGINHGEVVVVDQHQGTAPQFLVEFAVELRQEGPMNSLHLVAGIWHVMGPVPVITRVDLDDPQSLIRSSNYPSVAG